MKVTVPARIRQALYVALFAAGVIVGALNVADVNTGKAVDVIAYLGTALGALAAGNVAVQKRNEDGAVDPGSVALGLVLGLALTWLLWHR